MSRKWCGRILVYCMIFGLGFSACSKKSTQSQSDEPPVPSPSWPTDGYGEVPSTVKLRWQGTQGAVCYGLQVSADNSLSDFLVDEDCIDSNSYAVAGLAPSTKHYWRVNAVYDDGKSSWSSLWSFTTETADLAPPNLSLPIEGAAGMTINPTLRWNDSPGAKTYTLQVSTDASFFNLVVDRSELISTLSALEGLANTTVYYWRVNAGNSYGSSAWSEVWSFTTAGTIIGSWTSYNTSNSGLVSNGVKTIAVDSADNKWFGTPWGVSKFDGVNWTTYNTSNSGLAHDDVTAIAIDQLDNKWFGTLGGGVSKFDGTNWKTYNTSNSGLVRDRVTDIAIDSSGNKWFGCGLDISKFDDSHWTTYSIPAGSWSAPLVMTIAADDLGNIWFGTLEDARKFDGVGWTSYHPSSNGLAGNLVGAIACDEQGNTWFGTFGGVSKFDGVNWITYNTSNSGLVRDHVASIAVDASGSIWCGSHGGGISRFDGMNWTLDPSRSSVTTAVDAMNNKWFAGDGGVTMLQE